MKKNSFIFSSNLSKFLLGLSSGIFLILLCSVVINLIIEKSNFRFSRIFSENKLTNFNTFFLGNSRSVSLNKITLENNSIFNISYNSLNYHEVKKILDALEYKSLNDATIYIELTSLIYDNIECRFTIFSNLSHYNYEFSDKCKYQFLLQRFLPISKVKNEIFLRILYYTFYRNEDQKWQNNYIMPKKTCLEGNLSPFAKKIISIESKENMITRANEILRQYNQFNIKFFITPIFNKNKNYALELENEFLKNFNSNKIVSINNKIDELFYMNCDLFADNLHLSGKGIKKIKFNFEE
jgi:hypothetical protein